MERRLRVHMPTRLYLRKYITFYEGEQPVINNLTPFRRFVFALLEKGVIRDEKYAPKWLAANDNATLTMVVTRRTFDHIGHTITPEKAAYINAFLNEQFDTALTMAGMNLHFRKGMAIKHALIMFCEQHGIDVEIDISMDNLLKKWHRKLNSLEPMLHNKGVREPLIHPAGISSQIPLFDVTDFIRPPRAAHPVKKNVTENFPADQNQLGLFVE